MAVSPLGPSGRLTSFREGIGRLPVEAAKALGDVLRTGERVLRITTTSEGHYALESSSGETYYARSVIFAAPSYAAAECCREFDVSAGKALESIRYADIAVVCTGYPRAAVRGNTNGFGFLVPRHENLRVLGCLWTSTMFPEQAPPERTLLRTMFGGYTDPETAALSDDELMALVRRELHPIMGIEGEPELLRIYRWRRGIPQYLVGHGDILREIEAAEARHPGLFFAGNAYRGVGLNDSVLSALRACRLATAFLRSA
jgi:oxygen-dependent protoporphyrinogen oxidase